MNKRTIVCYGDSNTHGYYPVGAESFGRFDYTQRWPNVMGSFLGDGYDVKEEGMTSRTVAVDDFVMGEDYNGLAQIRTCLLTHEPVSLLIVMLGSNDMKSCYGLSPEWVSEGLDRLILQAQSCPVWEGGTPKILVLSPPDIDKRYEDTFQIGWFGEGCAEKVKRLAPLYAQKCRLRGCYFMDAMPYTELNTVDYVHLTAEGHRRLGTAVADFVRREIFPDCAI